jgi:DNA-directed RNA polymerase subunit RPC12/RpoP
MIEKKNGQEPVAYVFECMKCGLVHELETLENLQCPKCGSHTGVYQKKTDYLKRNNEQ